jgi:sulfatase modifying factor 1
MTTSNGWGSRSGPARGRAFFVWIALPLLTSACGGAVSDDHNAATAPAAAGSSGTTEDGAAAISSGGSVAGTAGAPANDAAGGIAQGAAGGHGGEAGTAEAGAVVVGATDASAADASAADTGAPDTSVGDASAPDMSAADAIAPDTSVADTRAADASAADSSAADCEVDCALSAGTVPSSCVGLPENCGPNADESCCASPLVTGGTFYRDYDGVAFTSMGDPATISSFRLDKYEATVGRFRQFVSAWVGGWRPAPGSGKHTHLNNGGGLNNGTESGWNPAWESAGTGATKPLFPSTNDAWNDALACYETTWTPVVGANETLPVTCTAFQEAYAFCIWDGGFLPTDAEWNYAASGGAEQRVYPWGSEVPTDASLAVYSPCGPDTSCVKPVIQAPVGSLPAGNGKYGQADLAGNMIERVLDLYGPTAMPPMTPCIDCANLAEVFDNPLMSVRGGSYIYDASYLFSSADWVAWYSDRDNYVGFRCARSP